MKGYYKNDVSPQNVSRVLVGNSTEGQFIYTLVALEEVMDGKPCGLGMSWKWGRKPERPKGDRDSIRLAPPARHLERKDDWGSAGVGPWE